MRPKQTELGACPALDPMCSRDGPGHLSPAFGGFEARVQALDVLRGVVAVERRDEVLPDGPEGPGDRSVEDIQTF